MLDVERFAIGDYYIWATINCTLLHWYTDQQQPPTLTKGCRARPASVPLLCPPLHPHSHRQPSYRHQIKASQSLWSSDYENSSELWRRFTAAVVSALFVFNTSLISNATRRRLAWSRNKKGFSFLHPPRRLRFIRRLVGCLSVCLLPTLRKNYPSDLRETSVTDACIWTRKIEAKFRTFQLLQKLWKWWATRAHDSSYYVDILTR